MRRRRRANNELPEESEKRISKTMMRRNAMTVLETSTAWAFRWFHGAFYCAYCDSKYVDIKLLREHVTNNHLYEPPSKTVFSKLKESNIVKIDISQLHCRLCNISLDGISNLKSHIKLHGKYIQDKYGDGVLPFKLDDSNGFHCQMCTFQFATFGKINEHMNTHYQNYVCDTCGKGFVTKSRFRPHVQTCFSNLPETGNFACGICDEFFSSRAERLSHRSKVHRKGVRYNCPRCSEVFTTYHARANHLVNFHAEKTREYVCSICNQSFTTSSKRAAHYRLVHRSPVRSENHQCYYCSAHFPSKWRLGRHMRSHERKVV